MIHDFYKTRSVLSEVFDERVRQTGSEGFTCDHDDEHSDRALIKAAISYAYEAGRTEEQRRQDAHNVPQLWPWDNKWWKPKTPRRDLIRSIALLVAEVERRDRKLPPNQGVNAK